MANRTADLVAPAKIKSYTTQFMGTKTKWRKRLQLCETVP